MLADRLPERCHGRANGIGIDILPDLARHLCFARQRNRQSREGRVCIRMPDEPLDRCRQGCIGQRRLSLADARNRALQEIDLDILQGLPAIERSGSCPARTRRSPGWRLISTRTGAEKPRNSEGMGRTGMFSHVFCPSAPSRTKRSSATRLAPSPPRSPSFTGITCGCFSPAGPVWVSSPAGNAGVPTGFRVKVVAHDHQQSVPA